MCGFVEDSILLSVKLDWIYLWIKKKQHKVHVQVSDFGMIDY